MPLTPAGEAANTGTSITQWQYSNSHLHKSGSLTASNSAVHVSGTALQNSDGQRGQTAAQALTVQRLNNCLATAKH